MKISVITVNRNNREGLQKTILSVASQTEKPYEFIIIDGASTDGSAALLDEYASHISFSVSEPDGGIYQAMNKGVQHASGDYCIFMNSGDIFDSQDVMQKLSASGVEADIICGNAVILTDPPGRKEAPGQITLQTLYFGSLCHQAVLIRTALLREHPYDASLRIVADRKFFLQALVEGNASYQSVDVDVVRYDVSGFSARNRDFSEQEWQQVLAESIPKRIRDDYVRFQFGGGHQDDDYDRFYLKLRNYRSGSFLYTLNVLLLRVLSVFKKSARFACSFPLHNK